MKITALDKQTFTGETVEPTEELTADEANQFLKELHNCITTTGQTLSGSNLKQVAEAASRAASLGRAGVDGGATAGQYVLSPVGSTVVPKALIDHMILEFFAQTTNTGAATVNPFGLGVKAIKNDAGQALGGGEIVAGHHVKLIYNGTDFILPDGYNAKKLGVVAGVAGVADGVGVATINGVAPNTVGDSRVIELGKAIEVASFDANWNTEIYTHGIHKRVMFGTAANGPGIAQYFHVETLKFGINPIYTQIAIPYRVRSTSQNQFMREYNNGVWGAWYNLADNGNAALLEGFTAAQLRGVRVQNHITAMKQYPAALSVHIDVMDTAINCVAGEKVKISSTFNVGVYTPCVMNIQRNGVEIAVGDGTGVDIAGNLQIEYDNYDNSALSFKVISESLVFVDENPPDGLNTYSFHMKYKSAAAGLYINPKYYSGAIANISTRGASNVILET